MGGLLSYVFFLYFESKLLQRETHNREMQQNNALISEFMQNHMDIYSA